MARPSSVPAFRNGAVMFGNLDYSFSRITRVPGQGQYARRSGLASAAVITPVVRPAWLRQAAAVFQRSASGVSHASASAAEFVLRQLVDAIPVPASPVERQLLLGFSHQWLSAQIHLAAQGGDSIRSGDVLQWLDIPRIIADCEDGRPRVLVDLDSQSRILSPAHCTQFAIDIADLVSGHMAEHMTASMAASAVHLTRRTLDRHCYNDFGMTFKAYLESRRTLAAIALLLSTEDKIDAIAISVGFRSKKSLYRQVEATTGMTPASLRHIYHS